MASQPTRRSREELQLLAIREIPRAIAAALPLDGILSLIASISIIVFDATSAWFTLVEDGRLRTVVARGESAEELLGRECGIASTASRAAVAGQDPLILAPQAIDRADALVGPLAGAGQAVAVLPLWYGGHLVGQLGSAVAPKAVLDISFLVTLGGQAAAVIANARLQEESRTWRERLDIVFEHMAEAVLVYDGQGRLALANAAAQELLGDAVAQAGVTIAEIVARAGLTDARGRPLDLEATAAARALGGERVMNLEEAVPRPTGLPRHLLVSAAPLSANGRPHGAVVVARDITYIKELERMRAEFLSMVSHELRTPLTSVLGFAQLLERQVARGATPPDLAVRLRTIAQQAKWVDSLVEDLLDTSRAEAGRLSLDLRAVDLAPLVRRTVQESTSLAPDYPIDLVLPPHLPAVEADVRRVEQVLRNLLSNAVKYAPPGTPITVRLEVECNKVVVSVADRGPGIAKGDLDTLFVPFHRVRQAKGREVKGIGLGLFISRAIVETHRGEMWVHSCLGQGSTFYFSLPVSADCT